MKYLVFFGIVAAMFVTGHCLECYECSGDKCDIASQLKTRVNCTGTNQMCFKQIINEHDNQKTIVKRGCFAFEKLSDKVNLAKTISTEVYFCSEETCNGVGSFTSSLSILLVTLVALMFASEKW